MSDHEEEPVIPIRDLMAIADLGRTPERTTKIESSVRERLHREMSGSAAAHTRRRDWNPALGRLTGRRMPVAVGAIALGAVIAGVSLLATSGTPGTTFPDAAAALAEQASNPSAVVHTIISGDDVEGSSGARRETWATVDGTVTRSRTTQPNGNYTDVLQKRRGDSSLLSFYISSRNTVYSYPWTRRPQPPETADQLTINGIESYADAIRGGKAKIDGESVIRDTPVYRVSVPQANGTQVWFVSKDADHPKLLRIQEPCATGTTPCPATDFSEYSISDDQGSLQFPDHPGARQQTLEADGVGQPYVK